MNGPFVSDEERARFSTAGINASCSGEKKKKETDRRITIRDARKKKTAYNVIAVVSFTRVKTRV